MELESLVDLELAPVGVVEGVDSEGALQIEVRAADGDRWVVRRSVGDLVHLGRKLNHPLGAAAADARAACLLYTSPSPRD